MASKRKLPSGNYQIRWKDPEGKIVSKTFECEKDALIFKKEVEIHQIRYGISPSFDKQKKTFKELATFWVEAEGKGKRSLKDDISRLKNHLLPHFVEMKLEDITSDKITVMRSKLRNARNGEELSDKTVREILVLLGTMLRRAKEYKWITEISVIKKPKTPKYRKDFKYLQTDTQIEEFLENAYKVGGEKIWAIYSTAISTGMRLGEICGLTWDKINFETREIFVGCSYGNSSTKTGEKYPIVLNNTLLKVLQKWKSLSISEHVFPNRNGTRYKSQPRFSKEIFKEVLDSCSFQKEYEKRNPEKKFITFHSLRHTFASHHMMNGGDIFTLQKLLGHQDIQSTQIYAHLSPNHFKKEHSRFDFMSDGIDKILNEIDNKSHLRLVK